MTKSTPLSLPEIQLAVASHMGYPSLVQCLRVCKAWYQALLPLVWREVRVRHGLTAHRGPSPHSLKQHHELVHHLVIESSFNSWSVTHYPNLKTLTIEEYSRAEATFEDTMAALITLNTSIVGLRVYIADSISGLAFWRAASGLDQLASLHLRYDSSETGGVAAQAVEYFLRVCTRLQYLEALRLRLVDRSHIAGLSFPRMRTLRLWSAKDITPIDQLEFISQCPGLESLVWHGSSREFFTLSSVAPQFAGRLASGMWPALKALNLLDVYGDDEDIALVINGMAGMTYLTELGIAQSTFGPSAFKALRHYFSVIRHLNLTACIGLTSAMSQEILSSCPQLVELRVGKVLAKDIVDGKPWACLSIKLLRIQIGFDQGEGHLQPLVFKQLSRLVRLETLSIGRCYGVMEDLDFRLQSGMGVLASLKEIRTLSCLGTIQMLEEEDVKWIANNWRKFERFVGSLNEDNGVNFALERLLVK